MKRRILAGLLACMLICAAAVPASAAGGKITHGTADEWITADMCTDVPPADYHVNPATQADAKEGRYNAYFLDTELQTVSIDIDQDNLNYLLQNADQEPYVMTTSVTIGDTTLGWCGLRTKGNYTLWHAYADNPGSDRFSFTVNFGKYITKADYGEKQNFYGCEKISFNNFFFDKSMMKEFFALKLMDEMGLPTPQYGLAKLYINGDYYGVYFMVEALDETILEQHWNLDSKQISDYLVKPTGTKLQYNDVAKNQACLWEYDEETYQDVEAMLPTVMEWVRRLNKLSNGTDFNGNAIDINGGEYLELLEKVLDLDEVVKYFAVASWLCQTDNMFVNQQNFGLYISEAGVATLLPWDYDLSFGCYYPSTAEATANYPLDVMYQLDRRRNTDEKAASTRLYAQYPLFNVIYQNDALMEQYHGYMAECSQIAALGGTVASTGKTYDPGYFNSYIEAMEEVLLEAASEELADNVYYMNGISQPKDVEEALPNLAKIIAMRSVGVWTQVQGLDATVSGAGCDLSTLGNALQGDASNSGTLTTVDAATGIFATGEYSGGQRKFSPSLKITALNREDKVYQEVKSSFALWDTLLLFETATTAKASGGYTLTIPLAQEYADGDVEFFSYHNGQLTKLDMTRAGNLFTGTTESLDYIVVAVHSHVLWVLIAGAAVLAVLAAAAVFLLRRNKGTKKPR